jgi:2-oxoglutarate dehydrogenase E2 component (dihydrolipoamide succinyltransferase)
VPAETGIITLKSRRRRCSGGGAVVCHIDTDGVKPAGDARLRLQKQLKKVTEVKKKRK